jgi:uncharacterized protein
MSSAQGGSERLSVLPPDLAEKVAFLASPRAYAGSLDAVETVETHMSFVFLAGDRAYKLKKPVRLPYLDFLTLSARETNCRAELRLNSRLAAGAYLRVAPLTRDSGGALAIDGAGEIVDWLVVMRRLPKDNMLNVLIGAGRLDAAAIDRLADRLAAFYRAAVRPQIAPALYFQRLVEEQDVNRDLIARPRFAIDHARAAVILSRADAALRAHGPLLEARAAGGFVVDGHGDLRPEHVCFENGVVIFDCLEFNDALRHVDPIDEIANLGVESARLGAGWLGPRLLERVLAALDWRVSPALYPLHSARRALLRARLSLAHLLDPVPRQPKRWEPQAEQYLALAEAALDAVAAASAAPG